MWFRLWNSTNTFQTELTSRLIVVRGGAITQFDMPRYNYDYVLVRSEEDFKCDNVVYIIDRLDEKIVWDKYLKYMNSYFIYLTDIKIFQCLPISYRNIVRVVQSPVTGFLQFKPVYNLPCDKWFKVNKVITDKEYQDLGTLMSLKEDALLLVDDLTISKDYEAFLCVIKYLWINNIIVYRNHMFSSFEEFAARSNYVGFVGNLPDKYVLGSISDKDGWSRLLRDLDFNRDDFNTQNFRQLIANTEYEFLGGVINGF